MGRRVTGAPRAARALRAFAIAGVCAAASTARAEPSDRALIATGLALAPPTYLANVALHEGSHALAAVMVGGSVESVRLFPPGRDPATGAFRFGWTYARGLRTPAARVLFYGAAKLTGSALLGGFAALVWTGAWPEDRYGQLALTVFATGLWVDFAKDVVLFARTNDVVKVFELCGFTGWRQVPARLVYAAMAVGFGLIVARGYQRTFDRPEPAPAAGALVVPVLTTAF